MSEQLYARPSDNLTPSGTVSLTAGAANAAFPLAQLYDLKSYSVFKATGTGCTIRTVFGGAKTLQGIALINTNLEGATITITNGAGLNVTMTAPTVAEDGHRNDPWKDLRGVALTTSTTWDIAITGAAANVAIGELLLIETLRTLPIVWDEQNPEETEGHKTRLFETEYDVVLTYGYGIRARSKTGTVIKETYRADMLSLERDARGALKCFLLLWDTSVNDALWVQNLEERRVFNRTNPAASVIRQTFTEQQKGFAL
jgi:hypothetical protein